MDYSVSLITLIVAVIVVAILVAHVCIKLMHQKLDNESKDQMIESHLLCMELGNILEQERSHETDLATVGQEKMRVLKDVQDHYDRCGSKETRSQEDLTLISKLLLWKR